jgi:hypothetical protein
MSTSAIMETANAANDAAMRRGYKAGVAAQRKGWSNWFNALPVGLKDAIQQHRLGGDIKVTRHKDGSLTIKVSAATAK